MNVTKIEAKKNDRKKTSLWQPNISYNLSTLKNDREHTETDQNTD